MYKKILIQIIFVLISVLFFLPNYAASFDSFLNFLQGKSQTRAVNTTQKNTPTHVKVGVFVLHIGKYDLQRGNIQMDFDLIFQCKPVCRDINFQIMNATSSDKQLIEKGNDFLIYRVQAELNKSDNLRNFPFDSHEIDIIIEDRELTIDKIIFDPDPATTAFDTNLGVVGFHLQPTWKADVTNHFYNVFRRTYSSYKFSMYITRPWLAGILKGILPALIIISCAFLALFMKIGHVSQRLSIATSTLIAAVVFHLNLTASLPPLGYVTYADMFMLINYLFLFAILIEVVITAYFIDSKHHSSADYLNTIYARATPAIWLILQIIIWLAFNPIHFNKGA